MIRRIALAAVLVSVLAYFAIPVLFVVRHQVERYSRRQVRANA